MGTVPTNKVFVHWKQLTSDDRFPFLVKGLEAGLFRRLLSLSGKTAGGIQPHGVQRLPQRAQHPPGQERHSGARPSCSFRFSGPWYLPVRQVGGESIALQDELDATEKQFVGGQHLRYTGTLKFYSPRPAIKQLYRHTALHCPVLAVGRHGFGYVMMDEGQHSLPSSFDGMQQTRLRCGS